MLVHQYKTEQELQSAKAKLSAEGVSDSEYKSAFLNDDNCWYIIHNEIIAPYMPEPVEMFNPEPLRQDIIEEEPPLEI